MTRAHRATGLLARLLVASLIATLIVVLPPLGAQRASAAPTSSGVVELEEIDEAPQDLLETAEQAAAVLGEDESDAVEDLGDAILSEPQAVRDAVMVGIEVDGDAQPAAALRALEAGSWTGWVPLEYPEPDDGPDDGTREAVRSDRNVSEPVWIGEAEAVQVMLLDGGVGFDEIRLHTVDIAGDIDFDPLAPQVGAADAMPTVIPRSAWDPNNDCAPRSAPSVAPRARFTVIHHTAGSNNYTQAQAASQLRAICLYHRNANGWSDIGYNIVVDRYGRTYEGRAGGLERAVVGAHAANFNHGSFGVGVMGCFDSRCATTLGSNALPSAALAAVDEVVAWKFIVHDIDPYSTLVHNNRTIDAIVGHRDVGSTSCPGDRFTPFVRGSNPMKGRVAPLMEPHRPPWEHGQGGAFAGGAAEGLKTFDPESGIMSVATPRSGRFRIGAWARFGTPTGWQVHLPGDATGNRRDDVVSYHPKNGSWWVSRSDGTSFTPERWGTFRTRTGWTAHVAGDFAGNGRTDVASYHPANGAWWVNRSTGSRFVAERWGTLPAPNGRRTHLVGDFTGNGRDDILIFDSSNGDWTILRSTGTGFAAPQRWARFATRTGWSSHLVADFDGDGRADVASYHAGTGRWWVSRSTGRALNVELWSTWRTRTGWQTHLAGDVTGNRRADLVSYHPETGTFWVSASTGSRFEGRSWMQFGTRRGWTNHQLIDADGDGRADVASYHGSLEGWWVSRSTGTHFTTTRW
jgi:hypothetical protein